MFWSFDEFLKNFLLEHKDCCNFNIDNGFWYYNLSVKKITKIGGKYFKEYLCNANFRPNRFLFLTLLFEKKIIIGTYYFH